MDKSKKNGTSLRDRITNDPEFVTIKRLIQSRYNLPLEYDIRLQDEKWRKWLGDDKRSSAKIIRRGRAFQNDIHALFKKFEIPDAWQDDLLVEIAGQPYDASLDDRVTPIFETYLDADGNFLWRCILTPETDLTNPVILQIIQSQQKRYAGNPPQPVKTNTRKLDWRPVYEWHIRHPLFSVEEIAEKIGYPVRVVKLKIAELETRK